MLCSLWCDIKTLIEALLGRWSLKVWMESIQKSANAIISETMQKEPLIYVHGFCTATYMPDHEVNAQINLFFRNEEGKQEEIELQRNFSSRRFTTNALSKLASEQSVEFPIDFSAEK